LKTITKELVAMTVVLVLAYLVLIHFTGFTRDVGALGSAWVNVTKTFQGRG
jgi:hypothetical protein